MLFFVSFQCHRYGISFTPRTRPNTTITNWVIQENCKMLCPTSFNQYLLHKEKHFNYSKNITLAQMYFIDSVFFIQTLLIFKQKSNQEGAVINVWEQFDLLLESLNRFQGICFLFPQLPNFAFQIDVKCAAFESFRKRLAFGNCV